MSTAKKVKTFSDLEGIWKGKADFSFQDIKRAEIGVKEYLSVTLSLPEPRIDVSGKRSGRGAVKMAAKKG